MAAKFDRRTLETMRRADLQKLCKDRGIRANMKNDVLIDLLVETARPMRSQLIQKRSSSMRVVSTPRSRSAPTRGIRSRVGSMIVHDDPVDVDRPRSQGSNHNSNAQNTRPVASPSGPTTRSRRAAESQRKVGLGRPKVLRPATLRASARNGSSNIPRRTKGGSKSISSKALIREKAEAQNPRTGSSAAKHAHPTACSTPLAEIPSRSANDNTAQPRSHDPSTLLIGVHPTQAEINKMQTDLSRLSSKAADVDELRTVVEELKTEVIALRKQSMYVSELEAQVRALREVIASLLAPRPADSNHARIPSNNGNPSPVVPSPIASPSSESQTPSALGKRNRASEDSDNISGVIGAEQAAEISVEVLETQVIRPPKKRGKLVEREPSPATLVYEALTRDVDVDEEDEADLPPPLPRIIQGPAFTVFTGREESPEPGPSNSRPSPQTRTPQNDRAPSIASITNGENQVPSTGDHAFFAFDFANSVFQLPEEGSSPAPASQPMPALDAPTSPTPTYVERKGRRARDVSFHPYGPPRRPRSQRSRPASRAATAPLPSTSTDAPRPVEAVDSPTTPLPPAPSLPSVPEEPSSPTEEQPVHLPLLLLPQSSRSPIPPTPRSSPRSTPRSRPMPPRRPNFRGLGRSRSTPPQSWHSVPVRMVQAAAMELARTGALTIPGLGRIPLPRGPDTPAAPMRRTMYGTERDGDTRFGDFGVEGGASPSSWSAAHWGY